MFTKELGSQVTIDRLPKTSFAPDLRSVSAVQPAPATVETRPQPPFRLADVISGARRYLTEQNQTPEGLRMSPRIAIDHTLRSLSQPTEMQTGLGQPRHRLPDAVDTVDVLGRFMRETTLMTSTHKEQIVAQANVQSGVPREQRSIAIRRMAQEEWRLQDDLREQHTTRQHAAELEAKQTAEDRGEIHRIIAEVAPNPEYSRTGLRVVENDIFVTHVDNDGQTQVIAAVPTPLTSRASSAA